MHYGFLITIAPFFCDLEPTSGLDANIAYEVISATRKIVDKGSGKLSVIATIHQPSAQLLGLFNHILVLGHGGMTFFGTVEDAVTYLASIGFPPSENSSPIDHFLEVMDCSGKEYFDFESAFGESQQYASLMTKLRHIETSGEIELFKDIFERTEEGAAASSNNAVDETNKGSNELNNTLSVDFLLEVTGTGPKKYPFNEFRVLLRREIVIAYRTITLYTTHVLLVIVTGLMFGITFYNTKFNIDPSKEYAPLGILLMLNSCIYTQIFKIPHLVKSYQIFLHERKNDVYGVAAPLIAELLVVVLSTISYFPGCIIQLLIMNYPMHSLGQILMVAAVVCVCAAYLQYFIFLFTIIHIGMRRNGRNLQLCC